MARRPQHGLDGGFAYAFILRVEGRHLLPPLGGLSRQEVISEGLWF